MKNKKAFGAIGWMGLILILIALGVGAYFLFSGSPGLSNIPSPPALP